MNILVTAFGPFAGRSENASSLALRELKIRRPEIRTRILPVDSVIAPTRLRQALRLIRPDVLILLGEAAGSKTIRLETTAFNELDFRIPDISGRQPTCPSDPPWRATHPPRDVAPSGNPCQPGNERPSSFTLSRPRPLPLQPGVLQRPRLAPHPCHPLLRRFHPPSARQRLPDGPLDRRAGPLSPCPIANRLVEL